MLHNTKSSTLFSNSMNHTLWIKQFSHILCLQRKLNDVLTMEALRQVDISSPRHLGTKDLLPAESIICHLL